MKKNNLPNSSSALAPIILDKKKYKNRAIGLLFLNMISFVFLYFTLVYPAYMEADFSNPAVGKFISSKSFKEIESQIFESLDKVNNGTGLDKYTKSPSEFTAVDPSQLGLLVTIRFKPQQAEANNNEHSQAIGYKYENIISVKTNPLVTGAFVFIEVAALILIFIISKEHPDKILFENKIIREFFRYGCESETEDPKLTSTPLALGMFSWYKGLSMIEKISFWSSIATFIGLALVFFPPNASSQQAPTHQSVVSEGSQSPAIGQNSGSININYGTQRSKSYVLRRTQGGAILVVAMPSLDAATNPKQNVCMALSGTPVSLTGNTAKSKGVFEDWKEILITEGECAGKSGWVLAGSINIE